MSETTLESLARRVAALEDLEAIRKLKARYLRACDERQPEVVRDCLDPENAEVLYEGFPPFQGRDPFVEAFRTMGCRPGVFDMHHGSNPDIELTGPNTATGKWAVFFSNIDANAGSNLQLGVEYVDDYVRHGGRWWIRRTQTKRTSYFMEVIGADGLPKVTALGESDAAFGEVPQAN